MMIGRLTVECVCNEVTPYESFKVGSEHLNLRDEKTSVTCPACNPPVEDVDWTKVEQAISDGNVHEIERLLSEDDPYYVDFGWIGED